MTSQPISIIVPCYNEKESVINRTVQDLHSFISKNPAIQGSEIVLVDDGGDPSAFATFPHELAKLVHHKTNRGYGAALKTGIKHARHAWIAIIDVDGTYPVEDFAKLLPRMDEFEMIVGQRSWDHIEWLRRPAKRILTRLASYLANYPIPDLNSGMRIFRREVYEEHLRVYPDKFSFSSTLTMVSLTNLYETVFVPINYLERVGKSSIHPIKDPARFTAQLMRLTLYFRPLRFFLPLSAAVVLL